MSRIDDMLAAEATAAENHPDGAPLPGHVKVTRPGAERGTVVSVRLSTDEHARLQAAAAQAHLPMSTLIRLWAVDRLVAEEHGQPGGITERLARLEQAVFPHSA